LGDMLELGERSREFHRLLAEKIAESQPASVFLLGGEMRETYLALRERRTGFPLWWGLCREELRLCLRRTLKQGDTVLFKASRSMELEDLAEKLSAEEVTYHGSGS